MISLKSRILILTAFSTTLYQFQDIVNVVDDIFAQFALPAFYKVRINHKLQLENVSFSNKLCIYIYMYMYICIYIYVCMYIYIY